MRYDKNKGILPAQSNPGGPFIAPRSIEESEPINQSIAVWRTGASFDLTGARVELEVCECELLVVAVVCSPQERAHAGQKLLEREGLRDVVVRSGVEPGNAVADLHARGEHEDRKAAAAAAHAPGHLEAVHARHEDVEDHRVRLVAGLQFLERSLAVVGQRDLVALELERAAERLAHRPLVVHDQDLHGPIVRVDSEKSLRTSSRRGGDSSGERIPAAQVLTLPRALSS